MDQQDLLKDPQSLNNYSYARNNPVIFKDQDGNFWQIFGAGIGAVAGLAWSVPNIVQEAKYIYHGNWNAAAQQSNIMMEKIGLGVIAGVTLGEGVALANDVTNLYKASNSGSQISGKVQQGNAEINKINNTADSGKLSWTSWNNYSKTTVGGNEYAQIGDRLYTEHAVERMMPRGLTTNGRSISPNFVEGILKNTKPTIINYNGIERQIYRSGTVEVVTENGGNTIITVNPYKY